MFKRSEKKIKAVFKMQFQATQIPQIKAKNLMISLVPVDVGKPTVRLPKSPIIEGTCIWENPIYETVKLVKETKTGRIREKFYYLIVSTGSSKAGFLGEVSIDFADLAEATKPLKLTLPLQTSKSGAVLQVTVQRMQGDSDLRCNEDNESPTAESYDEFLDTEEKDCYSYGKRNIHSPESEDSSEATCYEQYGSIGDPESDNNDAKSRDGIKETSHDKLINQIKMLERKVEVSEMEVNSLRQQIIKESKKGQQLSEQIVSLKQERDALKEESEQLKFSAKCTNQKETENVRGSLEDIKQELQWEKLSNKKLKLQLQKTEDSNSEFVLSLRDLNKKLEQKNTEISRLSSKIKALHSSPEALAAVPRKKMDQNEERKPSEHLVNNLGNDDETEMLKQKIESLYSEIEVHKKEKEEMLKDVKKLTQDFENLETENKKIYSTLQQKEKEKMEMQRDYTESLATVKQFKLRVASLEEEIKRQELQHSESLNAIDELEIEVQNLQKELENQALLFEEDLNLVTEAKIEQEQRAIRAEEAFRKIRWNNANAAERLQEEFKQLSAEMSLKIDETDKLAQKSIAEANDLRRKNEVLEDQLRKAEEEHQIKRDEYERILKELPEQNKGIWIKEKENLERQLASVRKEAENLKQENISMKSQIDQKKLKEENLHLEVKKLRLKNGEVKNNLVQVELEKENLKKEVAKLQGGLHKEKGQERTTLQNSVRSRVNESNIMYNAEELGRNMETNSIRTVVTDQLEQEIAPANGIKDRMVKENNGKNASSAKTKVIEDLSVKNGLDTAQIKRGAIHQTEQEQESGHSGGSYDVSSLLSEIASLKEKNKTMEEGLKEMHERYSEISLKFAEVEGERQQLVMTLRNLKNGKKN